MKQIFINFQRFLEKELFRANAERFIMLLSTLIIFFFSCTITLVELLPDFSGLTDEEDLESKQWLLALILLIVWLLYFLLMRKMIRQYKVKHMNFDQTNWKKGFKGKMKVIFKWFDTGE